MREEVQWFAEQMEQKLQQNDHKRHWRDLHDDYLIERLYQEAHELWNAIKNGEPPENIIKEAADTSNISMMIADNYSNRPTKQVYERQGERDTRISIKPGVSGTPLLK